MKSLVLFLWIYEIIHGFGTAGSTHLSSWTSQSELVAETGVLGRFIVGIMAVNNRPASFYCIETFSKFHRYQMIRAIFTDFILVSGGEVNSNLTGEEPYYEIETEQRSIAPANSEEYFQLYANSAEISRPVSTERNSTDSDTSKRSSKHGQKQLKQRRKKQHFEVGTNPKSNQTKKWRAQRRRVKLHLQQNDAKPTAVNRGNPELVIDEGSTPTSNEIYTGLKSKKRKSRKYGQTQGKVQSFQQESNLESTNLQKTSETNSFSHGNPQNQADSASEIKQKIKVARGKRREKLRLRGKDKELRLAERMERKKLLQEKREKKRRRKLERLERHRQNTESQQRKKNKDPQIISKTPAAGNFMAPPSIDYFIEKSSNYVDTNDAPPFEVIAVSVESPSKNIVSPEPEPEIAPWMIQKLSPTDGTKGRSVYVGDIGLDRAPPAGWESPNPANADGGANWDGGDLSCLKDNFQPAPEVLHADVKYLRNEEHGGSSPFLEVEYICHRGYKLQFNDSNKGNNIYCKKGRWIGTPPTCERAKDLAAFNETCSRTSKCDQLCYVRNGIEKCLCHKGFKMKEDRCEDINECLESASICEFGCINTIGSYRCKCPKGFRVSDNNKCIDTNECLLRNGHGPCQDTCINTWGSYKCSCDRLAGSRLSPDGHSCADIDECSVNNGGCSHTCLNTMGRAFCLCPEGWALDKDWKNCVDIDECAEPIAGSEEQRCEFGCINTPGSYSCLVDINADQPLDDEPSLCPDGFYRNSTMEDCQDINECAENNGGCFHLCVNTIGSYHCSCQPGFVFAPDKYNCIVINSSTDVSCPPLFPPKHGYLECSRPIASDLVGSDANGVGGRRRITNRPGSQCVLRCPTGFRINGKFSKQCSTSGIWVGDGNGTCIRYPTPKLICPVDVVLEPPPNETMAKLRIPRPKTDVNYDRDVSIMPEWMRNSEVALEVGVRNVTYTARHPVSKLTVSCSFTVRVLEGEPPAVKVCPQTQKYALSKHYESIKISWTEPVFTDNVNVTEISRTNSPGNSFGVGSHQIVYVAKDRAGYTARCVFKILVNVPFRPSLNHPLPIYHMFYK